MTDQQHPITPPPELVEQWYESADDAGEDAIEGVATRAARWGADQELEACCEWLDDTDCEDPQEVAQCLRAARRPKPPSLKEQALALVEQHEDGWRPSPKDWDTIRKALEQLND